jgi:hypothetical protein
LLRARDPSVNKIIGDFEVGSGHCSISADSSSLQTLI